VVWRGIVGGLCSSRNRGIKDKEEEEEEEEEADIITPRTATLLLFQTSACTCRCSSCNVSNSHNVLLCRQIMWSHAYNITTDQNVRLSSRSVRQSNLILASQGQCRVSSPDAPRFGRQAVHLMQYRTRHIISPVAGRKSPSNRPPAEVCRLDRPADQPADVKLGGYRHVPDCLLNIHARRRDTTGVWHKWPICAIHLRVDTPAVC